MKRKSFIALIAPLALGFAYFAAPQAATAQTNIVVGADTTFPPFETEVNGQVTGFDIDMIQAIAKAEGLGLTIKTLPFDGIIPSLQTGALDAAVAGITIKTSRLQNVDFSDAYYVSGLSILVKKGSGIHSFADLKGHVVATKKATSSADYLQQHGFDMGYVKQFQDIDSAYQALETGGADAVIFDNPVNVNFKTQHPNVETVGPLLTGEYYGIAISKKDPALVAKINDGLAKIKANGAYQQLFAKYFGGRYQRNSEVKGVLKPESVAVSD